MKSVPEKNIGIALVRNLVIFCGICLATALTAQESDLTAALTAQRAALEQARTEKVDVLAPSNFAVALAANAQAAKDLEKGRKPEKIRAQLSAGERALAQAQKAAEVARTALATALKTRDDAVASQAPKFAPEVWLRASERFADAAVKAEKGDVSGAQKRAAEADVLLREAELAGIKGGILGEARTLIAQADAAKVAEFAPRSLAAAKKFVQQSEQEISRNRYDADVPRALAQQATYEARHALYLAETIRPLLEKDEEEHAIEELILAWEEPLKRMAAELEMTARFDAGYLRPTQDFIDRISKLQQEVRTQRQDLTDRDAQIAILDREIKRLEDRLGGVSDERVALQRRLDVQAQQRRHIAQVETAFAPTEARIFRQADNLVISLMGITFPVGKSVIDPASYALMSKVQDAIKLFPNASLIVEGHTDADGTDSANLILSQDRADAVKQYLISNAGLNAEKISSIGYGEARPVASNQNAEGKARNRRIDLVVQIGASQAP
ncbi:MAG: OmpA family protein [Candidatus Obscuribacterales bacterium]|nr:OmpA family protein [Steroidobacteraceae bacterium]